MIKAILQSNGWMYVEASLGGGKNFKGYVSGELIQPNQAGTIAKPATTSSKGSSTATLGTKSQPGLKVIPCRSLPHQLFHRPGGAGGGPDFTHADHPTLSRGDAAMVALARRMSNEGLMSDMRFELNVLGGSEGRRMVDHFAKGNGVPLTHLANSPIGSRALKAPSFITMRNTAETNLEHQLSRMAASGTVDCNALVLPASAVPWLSFPLSDSRMLKAIIGGTQGHTIWLTGLTIDPNARTYSMQLRYLIRDDFGVDASDLYTPGLIAFWVLQHERTGFVPFQNIIDLTVTRNGKF